MTCRIMLIVMILLVAWLAWPIFSVLIDCYPDSAGTCSLTKW